MLMMMERHRCKVCRRCFPSGRSLGGHMRSHVAEEREAQQSISGGASPPPVETLGAAYGLRENPKRTWRYAWEVLNGFEHECRDCGKCFPSSKALFGHMKCHSTRAIKEAAEEEEEEERSSSGGAWKRGRLESSLSNNDSQPWRRRRTPRRVLAVPAVSSSVSKDGSLEENAVDALMMLSRDDRRWCCSAANPFVESSDNNSVVFEDRRIITKAPLEIGKAKKLGDESYASDSTDDESKKGFSKKRSVNHDLGGGSGKNLGFYGSNSDSWNYASKVKKERFDAYHDHGTEFSDDFPAPEKRSQFECTACNKTFHSYQALGGHRASHKRYKGCPRSSTAGGSETSVKTEPSFDLAPQLEEVAAPSSNIVEASIAPSKKKHNHHECLICGKVFSSGQALGGHKRMHFVTGTDGTGHASSCQTIVIKPPLPRPPPQQQQVEVEVEVKGFLDLNLPAPIMEESGNAKESFELRPWWAESSIKHEQLVSLISNS